MTERKWTLEGFDTFEGKSYPLPDEHDSEQLAQLAATQRLLELEKTQPAVTSGGQAEGGIQDQVFIVRPDGTKYRFGFNEALRLIQRIEC